MDLSIARRKSSLLTSQRGMDVRILLHKQREFRRHPFSIAHKTQDVFRKSAERHVVCTVSEQIKCERRKRKITLVMSDKMYEWSLSLSLDGCLKVSSLGDLWRKEFSLLLPHHTWSVWCTFACGRHVSHLLSEWHMTTHLFNLVAPEWPIYLCLACLCLLHSTEIRVRRRRKCNLSLFTVFQWTVFRFLFFSVSSVCGHVNLCNSTGECETKSESECTARERGEQFS